jgi:PBSX family phage terminase large subunit
VKLIKEYKPLFNNPPKTRYFFITGGRGSAKSFHVALFLVNLLYEAGHVILFTRWTMVSAHISIIPEFLEKLELLGIMDHFEITQNEIIHKTTGSRIVFKGIKTGQGTATANLKSIQGVTTWVLDEGEEMHDEDVFDRIDLSVRTKNTPNRVIVIMNPSDREHMLFKKFSPENARSDTTYIHTTYLHNLDNLSKSFIEQADRTKAVNIARFEHLFLGTWIDTEEGLLWNAALIEANRVDMPPTLIRKVVAIDPAITATKNSDETGIVVLGMSSSQVVYLLSDYSGVYTPNEWAQVAKQAFEEHSCDYYIAESNQGGDMVASNIKTVDPMQRVKLVRATKGKHARAEPVYSMYEQGKVKHVGYYSKLEQQMNSWNPLNTRYSPDRVDALVWGVTDLILSNTNQGTSSSGIIPRHKSRRL